MNQFTTLKWENDKLTILDQTLLPNAKRYVGLDTAGKVWQAINTMQVRGAPAIGVTAAYGMVIAARHINAASPDEFWREFVEAGDYLATARPTAVNLFWAIERMKKKALECRHLSPAEILPLLEQEATAIHQEDIQTNRKIGEYALSLFRDGYGILTHCNAGALATTQYGTALSAFYLAKERGIQLKVYADETRPRLQGASLTAYECVEAGIDVTLICDNMAPVVMAQGRINAVITGCDRVAANGDTANKIGTFGVSIAARYFGIPFYIAAPTSTIDMECVSGEDIPIEERDSNEITTIAGTWIAPKGVKTYNPAFDVTPAQNVTAFITEKGIVYPPFKENFMKIFDSEG